jgi:hypothetical protein
MPTQLGDQVVAILIRKDAGASLESVEIAV